MKYADVNQALEYFNGISDYRINTYKWIKSRELSIFSSKLIILEMLS